jgi:hypothetical protein
MEKKLDQIESKLDKLDERLDSIDKTLIEQNGDLKLHMARTQQNEKMIEIIVSELKPVVSHVHYMHGALKALGVLSLLLGIVLLAKKLFF